MLQALFTRTAVLFEDLFPAAEQPAKAQQEPGDARAELPDDDRLPARDESWYWAMHAHW